MSHGFKLVGCVQALLFAALLLVAGCGRSDLDQGYVSDAAGGPDAPVCNATTCPTGCCDSNQACQPGTSSAACGANGLSCQACMNGATCSTASQTCAGIPDSGTDSPPPACGAATCTSGCCDGNGNCQPGNQTTLCGNFGETCANCPQDGFLQCDATAQVCDTPQPACDSSSCPTGCCQPNGTGGFLCTDGTQNATCGTGGQACESCTSVGAICDGSGQCIATPCGPQNCSGCCLGSQCIPGVETNACGVGGIQCQNCGPGGLCADGSCGTMSSCSPANCGGCCDQRGLCQGGGDPVACGTGGGSCTQCPPNSFCGGGGCVTTTGCGPGNCQGCCDGQGTCQPGIQQFACGVGGQFCSACTGPDSFCLGIGQGAGGICESTTTDGGGCGPQNCSGCCDQFGTCQTGSSPTACGEFGQFCSFCGPGSTCQAGFCQIGSTCGPQNCAGCCDLNGFCQPGSGPTQCGNSGSTCEACATNFTCQSVTTGGGLCEQTVSTCGPANCATGCCNGNQCTTGTSVAGCGVGGKACSVCPTTDLCQSGACVVEVCGPNTCPNGCCDNNNVCQLGTTSADCGSGGQSCQVCAAPLTCQSGGFGVFPPPGPGFDAGFGNGPGSGSGTGGGGPGMGGAFCAPPVCGPSNCTGCCDFNGICQTGSGTGACGNGGDFCETCPASYTCTKGICEKPVTNCGPANCPTGCCQNNQCTTGDTIAACGAGGAACAVCPAGDVCGNNLGALVCAPAPCSAQNCPNGCCDQNNVCQIGTTSAACGSFGSFCEPCTFGLTCQQGFCQEPACGPLNCGGCCNAAQFCQGGSANTACGTGGENCEVCPANFTCNATAGLCEQQVASCGPTTCPNGCCIDNACVTGTNTLACGKGGAACADCAANDSCVSGACVVPPCSAATCPFGCCQGNTCVAGTTDQSCGFNGQNCTTCPAGNTCQFGFCESNETDAGSCDASNCTGCCDVLGKCHPGTANSQCGEGGAECTVCPTGATCTSNTCKAAAACSPANCQGCCDPNGICEAGFIDTACGGGGVTCANCTTTSDTCDSNVTPRACSSAQTQCPGPFPSCPSTVITPTPTIQNVCPNTDLLNAQEACDQSSDGATSASCQAFFLFEKTSNSACYACLSPFNVDYNVDPSGLFACMASFVNQTCNQQTGCYSDCIHTACSTCPAAGVAECETSALNGVCSDYQNNAQCVETAWENATGTICEPAFGGGVSNGFGDWLFNVGQYYCAQ